MTSPAKSDALLDTSVFIASGAGRAIDAAGLPERLHVSVVTVAELQAGVLSAADLVTRSRRLATSEMVAGLRPLPIDAQVAAQWARLRVSLVEAGRRGRPNDLWIAATALANGLPLVTQDDDFDVLAELGLLDVVKV